MCATKKIPRKPWDCCKIALLLFFVEVVEPVLHVAEVEGDQFPCVAFLLFTRIFVAKNLEQTCQEAGSNCRVEIFVGDFDVDFRESVDQHFFHLFGNDFLDVVDKSVLVNSFALANDQQFVAVGHQKLHKHFADFLHRFVCENKILFDGLLDAFDEWIDNSKVQCFLVGEISVDIAQRNFRIVCNVSD